MSSVAECWYLDVGQGAANVILLDSGDVILIDCGPAGAKHVLLSLLSRYLPATNSGARIKALILTHNDADHIGGGSAVLQQYAERIDEIVYLIDRPMGAIRFYETLDKLKDQKRFTGNEAYLLRDTKWQELLPNGSQELWRLSVLAPDIVNLRKAGADPNSMSGMLLFKTDKARLLFTGDASLDELKAIRARLTKAIDCHISTIPHHGARLDDAQAENDWVYSDAINTKVGIISAGSNNNFRGNIHPDSKTVLALKTAGVCVMCTQLTPNCSSNIEKLRPGIVGNRHDPSRSQDSVPNHMKGENLACAGTIVAHVKTDKVTVIKRPTHQKNIDKLGKKSYFKPMCRT